MSKIDDIKSKADEQRKAATAAQQQARAHDTGFDDIADYELWVALEELRSATKARRREESERDNPSPKIRVSSGSLSTNGVGQIIAA